MVKSKQSDTKFRFPVQTSIGGKRIESSFVKTYKPKQVKKETYDVVYYVKDSSLPSTISCADQIIMRGYPWFTDTKHSAIFMQNFLFLKPFQGFYYESIKSVLIV